MHEKQRERAFAPVRKRQVSSHTKRLVIDPETGRSEWVTHKELRDRERAQFNVTSKNLRFASWSLPPAHWMTETQRKGIKHWTKDGRPCFEGRRAVDEFVARSEGRYEYDD